MRTDERLPQQLLLVLAGEAGSMTAAAALTTRLRHHDVPALLATPDGLDGASDLRIDCGASGWRFWRERRWLQRLHPTLVLGADLSQFCRAGLLVARSEGLRSVLWTDLGRRLPWWTRLTHVRLPRLAATDAQLVSYLRAELLGQSAGSARLALAPLAAAGLLAATGVKRG